MNIFGLLKDFGLAFGGAAAIVIALLLSPEKVEKWSSLVWRAIYFILRRGEKQIVASDIQGRVNGFSRSLGREFTGYEPVGVRIQWAMGGEDPSAFFKEDKLVIRLHGHTDQTKNLVSAGMIFISKAVLPRVKRYLANAQRDALDLFVGRKLFKAQGARVEDAFYEQVFEPRTRDAKILHLVERFELIDKVGLFFPVLAQELAFLGQKVFYRPRHERLITEVKALIEFLDRYANREVGEETTAKTFMGAYCRCGIVLISKRIKRDVGDVRPYVRYVRSLLYRGVENFYLIGSGASLNKNFMRKISRAVEQELGVKRYSDRGYRARIKIAGRRQEVKTYLMLHRVAEAEHYYDREAEIRSEGETADAPNGIAAARNIS